MIFIGQIDVPKGLFHDEASFFVFYDPETGSSKAILQIAKAAHLSARAESIAGTPAIIEGIDGAAGDELQTIADALNASGFQGVIFLAGALPEQAALVASVSADFVSKFPAGKLIQVAAPIVGGKGGGRPDSARGAGKLTAKIPEALAHIRSLLAGA